MRLQRLEIAGFKSFSDRAELSFDTGVTAIVGPNGCGKSNLADAITWVLGEQSAKSLRGDRMEDVIFSGSDARKATAAAEVRLRLSGVADTPVAAVRDEDVTSGSGRNDAPGNGDGAGNGQGNGRGGRGRAHAYESDALRVAIGREVEVTRRLYRSGESEYLIDGQVCRLRDVHDLLMDTGLGAKAYAIIEQGKIGMILSTRPTDRRQLIEEAAGITKYKTRRRAAELKLEASQGNLTRIDDIVFEVEKQRGALKPKAAKARRYRRLRDELQRWEKVLFARRYRQLRESVESGRHRLAGVRSRETAAAGHLSQVEGDLGRLRIELAEAERRSASARDEAHARELEINRRQQQIEFNRQQIADFESHAAAAAAEVDALEARRGPGAAALVERRAMAARAEQERDEAAAALTRAMRLYETAHYAIEGLEGDVEAARSEVFAALNAATTLRHALEHAAAAQERVSEDLAKLDVETADLRIEAERASADRDAAAAALKRAHQAIEATRIARTARESELASARIEHEWRAHSVRSHEHELASLGARLRSLEELDAARAGYGDAPRMILAQANGKVGQKGAVADYLEVDREYERAVESCLGDLLQHVIVDGHEQVAAGLELVRSETVGRCGFLVLAAEAPTRAAGWLSCTKLVPLSSVIRVSGPYAEAIRNAIGECWIASSFQDALEGAQQTPAAIATLAGDVFRGSHLIDGGSRDEGRGILATKREIKDLRDRIAEQRTALARLAGETAAFESMIAQATAAITALNAEHHTHEKAILALELQLARVSQDTDRLDRKFELIATERRRAEEERTTLAARQQEARESIQRLEAEQRAADERLALAQRRLFEAREAVEGSASRVAEARVAHAALLERAAALAAEVARLEEASGELDLRVAASAAELQQARTQQQDLRAGLVECVRLLDDDIAALNGLRDMVRGADDAVILLRDEADGQEIRIREARHVLEEIRAAAAELDVERATAESDLTHLAASCAESVQASLEEVVVEVEALERDGALGSAAAACLAEPDEPADEEEGQDLGHEPDGEASGLSGATTTAVTAEEAIRALRARLDRLGPVNMMAIEQFDELETRHTFLTTQRKDLVDSIAATAEAIKRIDQTSRARFEAAFNAINQNFQETFSTLFGGGRAGLALLDEADLLEAGIEIIASPPGKRLQNVQLLSGGEKALTAIALMFAIFKYKPSPFCLLDEIDAPLDDANIGRFIEMLRAMLTNTQFILITHNRKTMEIADRLYGVTMEEPGVSKLISVRLN